MKWITCLILVLFCSVADARTPDWILSIPGVNGYVDSRPDADQQCSVYLNGRRIDIRGMKNREQTIETQFLFWKVQKKVVLSVMWEISAEPLMAPPIASLEEFIQAQPKGEEETQEVIEDGSIRYPDPVVITDEHCKAYDEYVREASTEWLDYRKESSVRITGDGEIRPGLMLITLLQFVEGESHLERFILDEETKSIWKAE